MDLRPPPSPTQAPALDKTVRILVIVNLLAVLALGAFFLTRSGTAAGDADPQSAEHAREVASKLKSAGALDEASALYEVYLKSTDAPDETRASVAYSLGSTYLDDGRYEKALRWFYEAEALGISVGSARVHYARGKARLRTLLEENRDELVWRTS